MKENRQIKFRAWHKIGEKMFYPAEMSEDQLTLDVNNKGFINVSGVSTRLSEFIIDMIPMQYTGRKDKNDKEIYEGDLIKIYPEGDIREIIYDTERASFIADEKGSGYDELSPELWEDNAEVIGNIYENSNLLQNTNE